MQVEDIAKAADNKQALMLIHKGKYKSEIVRAQIYDQTYHICICIKIDLIYPPFSLDQSRFVNLMSFGLENFSTSNVTSCSRDSL